MRPLAPLALTALLANPTSAQSRAPYVQDTPLAGTVPVALPTGVRRVQPHPDGGVNICYSFSDLNGGQLSSVLRVGDNGRVLWTRAVPTSGSTGVSASGVTEFFGVSGAGATVLEVGEAGTDAFELVSFGTAGQLRWQVTPGTGQGEEFSGSAFGFDSLGNVYAAGRRTDASGSWISAMLVDGATGAVNWRVDLAPAPSFLPRNAIGGVAGGDLVLVYDTGTALAAARLTPSGQVVHNRTSSYTFGPSLARSYRGVGVDGSGFAAVLAETGGVTEVVAFDVNGGLAWEAPCPDCGGAVAFAPGPDAVIAAGASGAVHRFTAAGTLDWTAASVNPVVVGSLVPREDGSFNVIGWDAANPIVSTRFLRRIGADGSLLGDVELGYWPGAPVDTYTAHSELSPPDRRGNVWIAGTAFEIFAFSNPFLGGFYSPLIDDGMVQALVCGQTRPNASGATGELEALGSRTAARDNVTLLASNLPALQFVMFLNARSPGFIAQPGGSRGDLCLGGSIARYNRPGQVRPADGAGRASLTLDLPETPTGSSLVPILAGDTWFFQAWHREPLGSHFTSAIAVTFQ